MLFTATHLGLFLWGVRLWWRTRQINVLILTALALGLVYDNLVIASGRFIGIGPTLQQLNYGRFLIHELTLPWLILASFEFVQRAGHQWASGRWVRSAAVAGSVDRDRAPYWWVRS